MKKAGLFIILTIFVTSLIIPAVLSAATRGIRVVSKGGQDLHVYESYHALVVGVSVYKKWPDLPYAVNDAKEVAQRLKELGFEVKLVLNPDSRELKRAINEMTYEAGRKRNRAILFYYAGHGETETMADETKMGYIIPKDCPLLEKDPIGFNTHAISMREIESVSLRIRSKHVLMLFDSCFSGALFALIRAVPNDITEKSTLPVRQYITAGREDEQVPDKSMFKRCFLIGLKGNADLTGDGYITGSEMGMYLADNVVNYTRRRQHPQYGKINNPDLDQGDFIFVPLKQRLKEAEQEKERQKQELALAEQVKKLQEQMKVLFEKKGDTEKKTKDALIEKKNLEEKLKREAGEHRRREAQAEARIKDLEVRHKASLEKLEKEAAAKTALAAELKRQRIIEKELKQAEEKRKNDERLAEEKIKKLEAERLAVEKQLRKEAATKQALEEERRKREAIEEELKRVRKQQHADKELAEKRARELEADSLAAEERVRKEAAGKKALEEELKRQKIIEKELKQTEEKRKNDERLAEEKIKKLEAERLAVEKQLRKEAATKQALEEERRKREAIEEELKRVRKQQHADNELAEKRARELEADSLAAEERVRKEAAGKKALEEELRKKREIEQQLKKAEQEKKANKELMVAKIAKLDKKRKTAEEKALKEATAKKALEHELNWVKYRVKETTQSIQELKSKQPGKTRLAYIPKKAIPDVLSPVSEDFKLKEIAREGSFIAYANGTVLDTKTNLMWSAGDADVGSEHHSDVTSYCERYRGGGHTDWRMPTLHELETLYNEKLSNEHGYHITKLINVGTDCIWADHSSWGGAAAFNFRIGTVADGGSFVGKSGGGYASGARALPVRNANRIKPEAGIPSRINHLEVKKDSSNKKSTSGVGSQKKITVPSPEKTIVASLTPGPIASNTQEVAREGRFIAYANGTVLDTKTKLMWATESDSESLYHDVKRYIEDYRGGGYTDWRIPSMGELEEICDPETKNQQGYRINKFIGLQNEWVWGDIGWFTMSAFNFAKGLPADSYDDYAWLHFGTSGSTLAQILPVRDAGGMKPRVATPSKIIMASLRNKKPSSLSPSSPSPDSTKPDDTYVAHANGIVRNTRNGLEWKVGTDRDTSWNEASLWVQSLDDVWRMPSTDELEGLYKKGSGSRNMTPLLKTTGWCVWSAETRGSAFHRRFYFNFTNNSWYSHNADFSNKTRAFAVRSKNKANISSVSKPKTVKTPTKYPVAKDGEIARDGRFIAYANGTVLDTKTNLMWATKENGAILTAQDLDDYVANYRGGNYTDWRMPTIAELATIYNRVLKNQYGYHTSKLIDITGAWVWGSNGWGGNMWAFDFSRGSRVADASFGGMDGAYRYSSALALPVRSARDIKQRVTSSSRIGHAEITKDDFNKNSSSGVGSQKKITVPSPEKTIVASLTPGPIFSKAGEIVRDGSFIAYSNGTVLDTKTNLMWAGTDAGVESIYHRDATSYCEGYRGGGYTDWRMPTLDELETLYNEKLSNEHGYHITELIDIGTDYIWADHSRWGGEAAFNYKVGSPAVASNRHVGIPYGRARALPVRDGN